MYFTIRSEHITGEVENYPLTFSSQTSPLYMAYTQLCKGLSSPDGLNFAIFKLLAIPGMPLPSLQTGLQKSNVVLRAGLRCHCFYLPIEELEKEGGRWEGEEEEEIGCRNINQPELWNQITGSVIASLIIYQLYDLGQMIYLL